MALVFVVPGRLDQLTGGYLYDRHIVEGLREQGRPVDVLELPGSYPDADANTRAAAAATLARVSDGSTVIVDGLALPGLADCLAAESRRLNFVGFVHHPLSLETGLNAGRVRHYADLEARLWPRLKGAICPSEHTAKALRASGLPADRVAVVAPGIDKPDHGRSTTNHAGPLRLLAVGTVTPRKGHLLLVDALARLRQDQAHLDWTLTCIGSLERDPVAAAAVNQRITDHRLDDRITLLGEQSAESLLKAYQAADIFVLPSYHEGYGMVFAEAMVHGLSIIATTACAIADTVPADAAWLLPPGDVTALQTALTKLLTDHELRARLATSSLRSGVELPTWPDTVRQWMRALEQVTR